MAALTIQVQGGHRCEKIGDRIFLTDDSGDRVEVDREADIRAEGRTFTIPLVDGNSTVGPAEEAFLIASWTGKPIHAGARRFTVEQSWK